MSNALAQSRPESVAGARHSLCFVVDTDFGYLQGFAKSLRGLGVNTVEFVNSARLGENVETHNPDIVFINLNATDPYDCTRALFSLRECKFGGRVQLFGRCEPAFLESFRKIGNEAALAMLPVLQKPVDFASVRKVVQEQKLNTEVVSPPDLSLKKALTSNWINFLYQPQVDLKSKMVVSAETFVRVTHPQHGILSPERFLGGASDEDLTELAAQAIARSVRTSATFFNAGVSLKFAININVETLAKLPVAILVEKYRPQDDQWPGLVFDVTETQVLTKTPLLKARIQGLHQAGVSLAIDNFGRGNSSFGIFKELPFSEFKIDRSFVQGCADNKSNANVCKTMIELAHNFGSKASAVGIETSEEAQALAGLGCDIGQGYLFAKPMTEQELMTMVMAARAGSKT
jgi:EAL domain-containing protein (putative c-di-GMP-specific phosphodiesterase class I)